VAAGSQQGHDNEDAAWRLRAGTVSSSMEMRQSLEHRFLEPCHTGSKIAPYFNFSSFGQCVVLFASALVYMITLSGLTPSRATPRAASSLGQDLIEADSGVSLVFGVKVGVFPSLSMKESLTSLVWLLRSLACLTMRAKSSCPCALAARAMA
jgi:hypothetical protein